VNEALIEISEQELAQAHEEAEFFYVMNYLRDLVKKQKVIVYNRTEQKLMDTIDVLELDTGVLAIAIRNSNNRDK